MTDERPALGREGEALAEAALERAGYLIVERNWREGGVEIDRIAEHDGMLVFVEIRGRTAEDAGHPADTVRSSKQRRVATGALMYLSTLPPGPPPIVRFDVVTVVFGAGPPIVEIFADAFEAPRGMV